MNSTTKSTCYADATFSLGPNDQILKVIRERDVQFLQNTTAT